MFQFTNVDGEPIPKWANDILNKAIDPENCEEYNNLVHKVDDYFREFNKTHCSKCDQGSGNPKFAYSHGCCSYCAYSKGYFESEKAKNIFASHKELFDKVHGFFDESIYGCSLPRHVRSITCLRYCCDSKMIDGIMPTIERIHKIRRYFSNV